MNRVDSIGIATILILLFFVSGVNADISNGTVTNDTSYNNWTAPPGVTPGEYLIVVGGGGSGGSGTSYTSYDWNWTYTNDTGNNTDVWFSTDQNPPAPVPTPPTDTIASDMLDIFLISLVIIGIVAGMFFTHSLITRRSERETVSTSEPPKSGFTASMVTTIKPVPEERYPNRFEAILCEEEIE
jgi:hypothetical protein